jgi:hypothetical protein
MITTVVIALLVGMLLSLPLLKWGRRNDERLSKINPWAWLVAAVLGVVLCVFPYQPVGFDMWYPRFLIVATALVFFLHPLSNMFPKTMSRGLYVLWIVTIAFSPSTVEKWLPLLIMIIALVMQNVIALSRQPLFRRLNGWLFALTLVLAVVGATRDQVPGLAVFGTITALAAVVGVVIPVWLHGAYVWMQERKPHRRARHRFLCPHCLFFGSFQFACGACGKEVDAFVVETDGAYVDHCSHCRALLFSHDGVEGFGIRAYCKECERACDRSIHHERQVRVVVALRTADFDSLVHAAGVQRQQTKLDIAYACGDDGGRQTYVLDFNSMKDLDSPNRKHAIWDVKSVWFDAADDDLERLALELGDATDRFIRETEQPRLTTKLRQAIDRLFRKTKQRKLTAYVRQTTLPPVVRRVLESRFETVEYGVTAEQLLFNRVGEPEKLEAHPAPEQVPLQLLTGSEASGKEV